jgi:putative acyl-CoA dehydrogenase
MAVTLQAALLVRHGHPAVADAFAATRLAGDRGHAYGTLPAGARTSDITARATPAPHLSERKRARETVCR